MLRSCKQHPSAGCCLPFTAYRTSIGGKWTRFSRKNNNANSTAQTSFALFPTLVRLFAVILTVPVLFSRLHLFARIIGRANPAPTDIQKKTPKIGCLFIKVAMTYSPTKLQASAARIAGSLVPAAIGRTQHGRSSCRAGRQTDGTTRRGGH